MYYKLHENMRLRGWAGAPYALRHSPSGTTRPLTGDVFSALSFCDGNFDCESAVIPPRFRQIIKLAEKEGAVVPCEKGDGLAEKQKYKTYPCKVIEIAHWSITGKCNMRCRHCYMSAPQAKYGEISHEKALDVIEQLASAGIAQVNLTGGEPLVREDFLELVDSLSEKEIRIKQIYTNGLLVNERLLDELDARGVKPEFSLSFDGVGWHDWLRGYEGAEEKTVKAIKLLVSRGFEVSVESAYHRDSVGNLSETMRFLAEIGVSRCKTNPVSNSGNWLNQSRELDLPAEDIFEEYLKFIPGYIEAGSPLTVQLGGFFGCEKGSDKWNIPSKMPFRCEEDMLNAPICGSVRCAMYISADLRLLPCMPLAGLPIQDEFPNLYDATIAEAMSDSLYLDRISAPISELYKRQPECAACEHRLKCGGGCRAAALSENSGTDYFGIDSWICRFFKGGYEKKIEALFQ